MLIWILVVCLLLLLLLLLLKPTSQSVGVSEPEEGRETPELICKPSALADHLLKSCPTFSCESVCGSGRWARAARLWPDLQTLWNGVCPAGGSLEFIREHLQLSDQGLVALDWAVLATGTTTGARRPGATPSSPPPPPPSSSVLLIIPNALGKLSRNVCALCALALRRGYSPVLFNRRGHNSSPLTTRRLQPFGETSDLQEAVGYIRHRHPTSRLYAVSESTGSGLLLSYLGERGSSSYMTAASCISPIFSCRDWYERGPPWLYHWLMVLYQKTNLSRYATALSEVIDTEKLFRSNSLREMEEVIFCQSKTSSSSWESYWEKNDPLRDVDEVAVPLLCVCSKDDSFRGKPEQTLPFELFETNPYFFLLLTEHGGHCGFLTSSSCCWSHEALLEYFKSVGEFFRAEERTKNISRRKGSAQPPYKRRGVTLHKREVLCSHNIHEIFNWQRSYTR